jgi:hypothetical protein
MHKSSTIVTRDLKTFLAFMKQRYQLYHASNVFFRDFHFGVMTYLESHGVRLTYTATEEIAREVIRALESQGILRKLDDRSWLLSYPEYRKESKKAEAAPKAPAPQAAAPAN